MSHGYALSRCRCWLRCLLSQLSVGTPLLLLGLVAARPAFADKALIHVFINQRQESGRPWHRRSYLRAFHFEKSERGSWCCPVRGFSGRSVLLHPRATRAT